MRIFNILLLLILATSIFASPPHPVLIELQTSLGNLPDPEGLSFQAWRLGHPNTILDLSSTDCYYPAFNVYLHINCGSFAVWNPGDTLHVEVFDDLAEEWFMMEYELDGENIQTFDIENGGMILGVRLDLPDETGFRYYDGLLFDLSAYISYLWDDNYIIEVEGNEQIEVEIAEMVLQFSADGSWFGSEMIYIMVDDNSRSIAVDSLTVEVYPNHSPVFDFPVEGFFFAEDENLSIELMDYSGDFEGDSLSFSISGNTEIICELTGSMLELSAPLNWNGEEVVTLTAEDWQYREITVENVEISVIAVNDLPELTFPEVLVYDEDEEIVLLISEVIYDVENDTLTISANGLDNISMLIADGQIRFIPAADWYGTESAVISVFDQTGTVMDSIMITYNPVNDAPEINLPEYFTFAADLPEEWDISTYINDVDNTELAITAESENMSIEIVDYLVEFTPINSWHGTEDVVFTVDDETARIVRMDTITVNCFLLEDSILEISSEIADDGDYLEIDLNTSEVFEHWSVSTYQIFLEYDPYYLQYFGHSLEGTIASGGIVNCEVNEETNPAQIEITYMHYLPLVGEGSIFKLWFQAGCYGETEIDGIFAVYNGLLLAPPLPGLVVINDVGLTNHPPQAIAGDDITIAAGEQVILDGSQSWDPDGGELEYFWDTPAEIILDDVNSITPEFTAPVVDEDTQYVLSLQVTDPEMNSQSDELTITVLYQNFPPSLTLPDSFDLEEDTELLVDFTIYSNDLNGDDLQIYSAGSDNITIGIDDLEVSIIPDSNWFGSEMITFTISDNRTRLEGIDSLLVNVSPVNDPPVPEAGEDIIIRDGESGTLDASSTYDIDSETLSFLWQAGDYVTIVNAESEIAEFSVAECDNTVSEMIYLTVDDLQNRLVSRDSLLITINDDEVRELQAVNLYDGNIELSWLVPSAYYPELNYNIYLDSVFYENTTDTLAVISCETGFHEFGVEAVYIDGSSDIISIQLEVTNNGISEIPLVTKLNTIYPNPFNPETTIAYQISETGNVNLAVYNLKGQKVAELVNSSQEAGQHSVVWNAAGQASGIYFVKMTASGTEQIQKLILMK
ncbi:MAG: T9SS type A sorting domain-containing protein [Candidatus Cloacimonetes bacterium]|nr:T9SS type A sorting domain-containing protein [Candidatus Cloacimonadota bacterium]